jgi:5-(hydroxymethyl)furfural/furfural oxidase
MSETFDYVIAGAGSAGCVLAARLTEDAGTRVALLEAGRDFRWADAPAHMQFANPLPVINDDDYRWPNLLARRSARQAPRLIWRGRGVGGSSLINGMIAIRPVPDDFDRWAELGCTGWDHERVLPYLNKLERDIDAGNDPWHGSEGPVPVYRTPESEWGAVDRALKDAALDLGYGWAYDHNAPGATGVSPYAINRDGSQRISANNAYLEPARSRPNLVVFGDALVDRVALQDGKATGVHARIDGSDTLIEARTVIISAGALHTPAILQRSGIGPGNLLRGLGIDVVADLPVGENLMDHPVVFLRLYLRESARAASLEARHTNCCVRYSSGLGGGGLNDMIMIGGNIRAGVEDEMNLGGVGLSLFENFSAGTVTISTTDAGTDPIVEENMLSDPRDLIRMRDGARRLLEISRHAAIQDICERAELLDSGWPIDIDPSDDEIDAWLLATCSDAQHASSTCRMGAPEDRRSVVDPDCRVKGVENLRVIDASIMPITVRANTHLAVLAIAEAMADRLRHGIEMT